MEKVHKKEPPREELEKRQRRGRELSVLLEEKCAKICVELELLRKKYIEN